MERTVFDAIMAAMPAVQGLPVDEIVVVVDEASDDKLARAWVLMAPVARLTARKLTTTPDLQLAAMRYGAPGVSDMLLAVAKPPTNAVKTLVASVYRPKAFVLARSSVSVPAAGSMTMAATVQAEAPIVAVKSAWPEVKIVSGPMRPSMAAVCVPVSVENWRGLSMNLNPPVLAISENDNPFDAGWAWLTQGVGLTGYWSRDWTATSRGSAMAA
jgi:hypothetical protein